MLAEGVISESFDIRVFGAVRRYLLIRPDGMDPATLPTVLDLHGSGSWPAEHAATTAARAFAALGAIVVIPQAGIRFRMLADWPAGWAWNVPGSPLPGETTPRDEPDDLGFIQALTDRLIDRHGVDPHRIHLRGFSGGARLASHLMARMTDQLASVCCVAGVRFVEPSAGWLPPLLAIHGWLDAVNPHAGGGGPRWSESVESVISQWAAAIGCGPTPRHRVVSGQIREARYVDAEGFAAVRLIAVADAEHSWPGTQHGDHIKQFGAPGSWDASQAHWHFVHEVERNDIRVTAHGDDRPLRGNVTEGDEGTTTVPPR
jgi:polyhydroxybutyrate depolymerase